MKHMKHLYNYWTKAKGERPEGMACEQLTTDKKWYSVVTYGRKLTVKEMQDYNLVYESTT